MEEIQPLLFGGSEPITPSTFLYRSIDFANLHVVPVAHDLSPEVLRKRPISLNYQGLCPLHQETRPSFVIRPLQNSFCCYGCGERGGAFQLLALLTANPLDYLSKQFDFYLARDGSRLLEILRVEHVKRRFDFNRHARNFGVD